jgi:hypothetical protein
MALNKKSGGGFVYRGKSRTTESIVRRSKQSGGLYDSCFAPDVTMFKAREGEANVRILPPTGDATDWGQDIYIHYNVGPDNGSYLCLDKMKGEKCPICEARRKAHDEEADQLRPNLRVLCWVIDRDNQKAGPQLWSMPLSLSREINLRSVDKKTGTPILIDHPEEGYDIVFTREGSDKRTKYTAVEVVRESSPLSDEQKLMDRWLKYISDHPLQDVLVFYPPEHIEKVLFGKGRPKRDEEEAEDEDEAPKKKASKYERKPKDEEEEEEEESEDEEEEEDDGEEEADEDEEDDEDEDEDEEADDEDEDEELEEEEKPQAKASKSARVQLRKARR